MIRRTVVVKLAVPNERRDDLRETTERFQRAAQLVADRAFERDDYLRRNLRRSVTDVTTDTSSLAEGGDREPIPVRGDGHGSATYCEDCGLPFGTFDDSRVRSKDLLKDCLENVGERLREEHDDLVFNLAAGERTLDTIGARGVPWATGDDLDFLAIAVHLAVKYGDGVP